MHIEGSSNSHKVHLPSQSVDNSFDKSILKETNLLLVSMARFLKFLLENILESSKFK